MTRFAQKAWRKVYNKLVVNPYDSGIVAGWNMKTLSGGLPDVVAANNGTYTGPINSVSTLLGNSLKFCGRCIVNVGSGASLRTNSQTISCWIKQYNSTTPNTLQGIYSDQSTGSSQRLLALLSSEPYFQGGNGATTFAARANANIPVGKWSHVVGVLDYDGVNTTIRVYTDSVLGLTTATFAGAVVYSGLADVMGYINSTRYFNGEIANVKVYNEAKDQAWITAEYLKGARAIQFATDWGHKADGIARSGNEYIGGGPFRIISGDTGSTVCTADTINGETVKVLLQPSGVNRIYAPWSNFGVQGAETGYGSWSCWAYIPTGYIAWRWGLFSDDQDIGASSGYRINVAAGTLAIVEAGVGNVASTADFPLDTWFHIHVTRRYDGYWGLFINYVLKATGTDNTTQAGKYTGFEFAGNGSKVALASRNGGYAITKYLGVTPPRL